MKYKAVIFDLFGTLVDNFSRREHRSVHTKMAETLSLPTDRFLEMWTRDTYIDRTTGRFPTTEANILYICRALGAEPNRAQLEAAAQMRLQLNRRWMVPRPDAVATLRELKGAGVRLGLISDCSPEVPLLWDETPFSGLFDEELFSCRVFMKKPDPRIYLLACRKLRVSPEDCLYVGDGSSRELTGAAQVGMSPVLIRTLHEATYDPDRVDEDSWEGRPISALSEVIPLVLEN
jgi:putative hydrolase of the HAD superfamily